MPDFEGKPIRKRGYYRAVKCGKAWAVHISKKKGLDFLFAFYNRNIDWKSMFETTNSFLNSMPKVDWDGGYITMPFKLT